ncbi:YHYH protein [Microbacterium sp. NPDC076911]|uniref:YHYH protein n=1 Tax=Microbacterium sp. NPDC076911 TaxID=3154958 RepID=UPI00343D8BD2
MNIPPIRHARTASIAAMATLALLVSGCAAATTADSTAEPTTDVSVEETAMPTIEVETAAGPITGDCDSMAATFRDVTSANAALPDPSLTASCDGDSLVVVTNSIPDYVYVATTPGSPSEDESTYVLPESPVEAADPSPDDVPRLGSIAVAVNGVPIYGPTEGTGGDVLSLAGALSECGSHNGPTAFHMHLFGWAEGVDCLYSAEEVESGDPTLVGWAADGYPIMSGLICDDDECSSMTQLASSWELTDESLFATDTWAAHSYVEGSGDLDQCNGRVDSDGQYRYYTTPTFPYILGCYHGEVSEDALPRLGGGQG